MNENEYQCAMCDGIFEKGRPDEEAWAEHDSNFPGEPHAAAEIVCEDCYEKMIAILPMTATRILAKLKGMIEDINKRIHKQK